MTRELRKGQSYHGLVVANGGVATYQHVIILSSRPRQDSSHYPSSNPLPEVIADIPAPPLANQAEGEAVIEVYPACTLSICTEPVLITLPYQTYTVEFNRDGTPLRGYVVGRLKKNGHRFVANHDDENTLQQLSSATREPIGRTGWVRKDTEREGRNLFGFEKGVRL
jgi:hypothetical protein